MESKKNEITIFDNPKNVKRLLALFYSILVFLLIIDPFIDKHAEFSWEEIPGFFAVYGFVSCVLVISIAGLLRVFVKRNEGYYD